jgi:hypothetical protein
MAQILTNANMDEFRQTGKVPEFVKPEGDKPKAKADAKPEAKEAPHGTEVKDEPKVEAKEAVEAPDADDIEDENGLTTRQKRELTAKMLKAVGAKHRAAMLAKAEAQEANSIAEQQFNERKLLEKRLEAAEEKLKGLEKPTVEDKEPQRADFKSDAEYWDAKIDWKAQQAVRRDRAARAEEQKAEAQRALDAARAKRNQEFAKTVTDWDEVATALSAAHPDAPPGHIQQYIYESDSSAAMMYYFGKHLEEYGRILEMTPVRAIAAIGKIEAKLEPAPETTKPSGNTVSISRAPAPIAAVPESVSPIPKDLSKIKDYDEFKRAKRELEAKQRRH